MSKHTPEPWKITGYFNVPVGPGDIPEKAPTVWIDRRWGVGSTSLSLTFSRREPRERILADSRLIVAAPKLLRALRSIVESADRHWDMGQKLPPSELKKARKLLTRLKQEGQET